jgi:hypothetical protein
MAQAPACAISILQQKFVWGQPPKLALSEAEGAVQPSEARRLVRRKLNVIDYEIRHH